MTRRLPFLEEFFSTDPFRGTIHIEYPRTFIQGLGGADIILNYHSFDWHQVAQHEQSRGKARARPCPHSQLLDACAQISGLRLESFRSAPCFCCVGIPKTSTKNHKMLPCVRFSACRMLQKRLEAQVSDSKLVWTKKNDEVYCGSYEGYMRLAGKAKAVGGAEARALWYTHVFEGVEDSFIRSGRVQRPTQWPKKRVIPLVESYLESLGTVVGLQGISGSCTLLSSVPDDTEGGGA